MNLLCGVLIKLLASSLFISLILLLPLRLTLKNSKGAGESIHCESLLFAFLLCSHTSYLYPLYIG